MDENNQKTFLEKINDLIEKPTWKSLVFAVGFFCLIFIVMAMAFDSLRFQDLFKKIFELTIISVVFYNIFSRLKRFNIRLSAKKSLRLGVILGLLYVIIFLPVFISRALGN